jgi:hypothetical protein
MEYMVLYIGIDDGEIKGVYQSDTLGDNLEEAENLDLNAQKGPLVDIDSLTITATESSPKCRYVRHGGRLWKVCK